ncbi:MAG: hypothetical protein R3F17_03765 [Planctomycetota bacterium]
MPSEAPSAALVVTGIAGGTLNIYGHQGGPFPPGHPDLPRGQPHRSRLVPVWRIDSSNPWLTSSPVAGVLAPGESTPVVVEIDHNYANALPVGLYPCELAVRTVNNLDGEVVMSFNLHVTPPTQSALSVDPANGLSIQTSVGSPAGNIDGEVHVTNTGSIDFDWTALSSEPWLTPVFPSETHFTPGETDTMGLRVDESQLAAFGYSTHTATVHVFDAADRTMFVVVPVTVNLSAAASNRVTAGLQAEYTFEEGAGSVVHDVSGVLPAMDLNIENPGNVTRQPGGMTINSPTLLSTPSAASRITDAVHSPREVHSGSLGAPGEHHAGRPRPHLGLSNGQSLRNFTLAQGLWTGNPSENFNIRCHATQMAADGIPPCSPWAEQHQHRPAARGLRPFCRRHRTPVPERRASGPSLAWWRYVELGLQLPPGGGRRDRFNAAAWLGEMFLMAVYDRALSSGEVQQELHCRLRGLQRRSPGRDPGLPHRGQRGARPGSDGNLADVQPEQRRG